jgi:hypothetical protein
VTQIRPRAAKAVNTVLQDKVAYAYALVSVRDVKGALLAAMAGPATNVCFVLVVPTVAGCLDAVARLGAVRGACVIASPRAVEPGAAETFEAALEAAGLRGALTEMMKLPEALELVQVHIWVRMQRSGGQDRVCGATRARILSLRR